MKLTKRGMSAVGLACAAALSAAGSSTSLAQVATLGKGHSILVNNGLQMWGLDQGAANFNYGNLTNANLNGVMWSWGQDYKASQLQPGQKWGMWTDPNGTPATALNATQQAHVADLVALQVGDEQQSDLENPNGPTATWLKAAQAGNNFPNQLLYVNSFYVGSDANYASFIGSADPDAISFDSYPFDSPYGSIIYPHNWLAKAGQFRRHALSSYLGIGGNAPRPYGLYLQTYESTSEGTRHPGDVEMRWQQFTAWTMGFTFVDAFTVGGSSSLFTGSDQNSPTEPRYSQFRESARQSRNLGPALTKLISYGYGPSIVIGRDSAGTNNPIPSDWLPFAATNAPPNQQYLTSLSATNTGTKNNGQPGDIYVGFFNPLHASFGDPAGEAYFMITNALGPYLNDPTATVADCQQQITTNFDTQYSGISTLQRLRRSDGQLEIVPLTRTTARQYQLQFTLEGGTGDLFKYNDGTPFVGFNNKLYWDNDANAAGNNTTTGAGMGGAGTWDAASNKWHNGSSNGAWAGNRDAIFWGTGGTVTLGSAQSVNSLAFKSNGYTVTGSTLTMAGQFISADTGVTATIGSSIAGTGGIVKGGAGTVILSNNTNTYTGGVTVTGGALQINADGALGASPASFTAANIILNGGTLEFGAGLDVANTRGIDIGPSGGTIDTQGFSNPAGYNATAGGFRGPGDLTKTGSGTFFASATSGGLNTTWKGRLIIKEGTWKIVASDGLPYNVPLADGLKADQVTLDGGTWQAGATMNITNARRGITVAAGGGTIDTQGFDLTWAGPLAGTTTTSTFTKLGSGILRFTGVAGVTAQNYNGNVNIAGGTLRLDAGVSMGDLASINVANVSGATLNVTGNETIGSLAGGGASGGNVTLSAITLTTGGNNASTTFGGVISGAGSITKSGTGTMTLSRANTYTGATTATGGRLVLGKSLTTSSSVTASGDAIIELADDGSHNQVIKTGAVTITGNGRIDLKDNKLITTSAAGTASGGIYSGIQGKVQSASNGGAWDMPGLTTSMPDATTGLTTIGVATGAQLRGLGPTETDLFAGQTITGASTVAMYTYAGDANMDGFISGDDYSTIDFNVGTGADGYYNGDFNYDGIVSGDDYSTIDFNFAAQGAPFPTSGAAGAGASVVAVPEPAACGFAAVAALAILRRRHRRRTFPV
ncbi:MAG: fibronectin-binding autotransporter adhesin [Humisphaera sp.]|nr:fibronectin-binding autotransporter adhesin [Humisphaera sp.]